MSSPVISSQAYGKDRVRVVRVNRHPDGWQEITDYSVRCMLSGNQFSLSYTRGDNHLVVATDSQKNAIYYLAKTLPIEKVQVPELFAMQVASFMVKKYAQVTSCRVKVTSRCWERMEFNDTLHPHSFSREGKETRWTEADVCKTGGDSELIVHLCSGFDGLEILKTTNSSFVGFWRDELTTLPYTNDRMLSTKVVCQWKYLSNTLEDLQSVRFEDVYGIVKQQTLDVFANDSRVWVHGSVQSALYVMAEKILKRLLSIDDVYFALPNIHYIPLDMKPFGIDNQGLDAQVYVPLDSPSGLITATVSRSSKAKL